MTEERKTEIFRNGEWQAASFFEIQAGCIFRLFEPDGEPVRDTDEQSQFIARSNAHVNKDGYWEVKSESLKNVLQGMVT